MKTDIRTIPTRRGTWLLYNYGTGDDIMLHDASRLTSVSSLSPLGSTCDSSLNASSPTKQISCPS